MTRAWVGLAGVVLGLGCIFTPKPSIPDSPDGGFATGYADAGAAADIGTGVVSNDDAGRAFDAPGADVGAPPTDSPCRPNGDGGYINADGEACDPTAVDAGTRDARCDAGDASVDAAVDATACDVHGAGATGREGL